MNYLGSLLIFIFNAFYISNCNEFKLSDSKVLLPRTGFLSINYTIRGCPNICHEWISETPEVVIITAIYDQEGFESKCSHQAVLTSVWQSNNKVTGTVYAKNIATGHSVKCDVIIDQIRKLEIETRTLELYLHETPEALTARAYDESGNTFSTLDGIPFEWSIHTSGSNGDVQNVLRFIKWTESEYSTPTLIGILEQQGLQGYMQLVSGLKTGAANVSLVFRDEKFKSLIKSQDVRFLVMANAALSPSLAYLIPNTQLSYKINVHSLGSTQEVKMPDNQYYLKISNTDLAELDTKGTTITAKKIGQTEVILIDRNIIEDFRHPSSLIYVVEPGYLTFHISPNENQWVLQTGYDDIYTITVRPFDFNSHPITMSDNIRLKTTIPTEYFKVIYSSPNGTYNVVKAIKEGSTILKSTFMFILLPNGTQLSLKTPVEGKQELIIFPPINVVPMFVVLPWFPDEKLIPGFLLTATGGSGEYKWVAYDNNQRSINASVSVDMKGFIKPMRPGVSHVMAADQRNLNNRKFSIVSVDVIRKLEFFLNRVEVEVNNEIDLPIIATDYKNNKMSHCYWLPFKKISEEPSNIEIVEVISPQNSNISGACALLRVRGLNPGFSKIIISLINLPSNKTVTDELTASITIGSYIPTKFIDPVTGFSTIGVRSIRIMNIINGPLPWILNPSHYFFEMRETAQSKSIVNKISLTEHRPNSKFHALYLKVKCNDIGEIDISVVIGNKPSLKNPYPVQSTGTVKIICAVPVRIKLVPKLIASNVSTSCPFKNLPENQHITINNKIPLSVDVVFTDKNGVQLERSESFNVKVEIKSLSKKNVKEIVENIFPDVIYTTNAPESFIVSSNFLVTPHHSEVSIGEIEVIAKSNSYREGKGPAFNLEGRLQLQMSKSMLVQPEKMILFQHEKVSSRFSIKFGSGYFNITTSSPDFFLVNQVKGLQFVDEEAIYEVIQRKVDYSQRSGIIHIFDVCFNSMENSKIIEIELVRPSKLQMFSLNRIQLGSQINVLVKVYDDTGREFPHESLSLINLDLHFSDNSYVISAHSLNSKEWFISPNEYSESSGFILKVNGEKLGFNSIHVSLHENRDIVSNILKIEVFPPLKLIPKHTVLLEGAEIQLSSAGGPQNCHDLIHYSIIKNSTIKYKEANIEFISGPNGLIKAINHGEISVTIKVEVSDIDPTKSNQLTVLSKDEGRVGVVQIKGLSIWSPTKNLLVGNSIPLWITFISAPNDLQHIPITGFSMTGSDKTEMSFKWNLNPPQGVISKLENVLEPAGINIGNRYLHSGMRLTTLNPGKQTIEVSITGLSPYWLSKDIKQNIPLISKLNIAIISKLEIIHPAAFVKTLLLPPSSRISLKSTLDDVASITYILIPYQIDKIGSKSKSKIHSNNILETNPSLSGNEVENFILHITSSQSIKLNTANEIVANQTVAVFVTVKHPIYSMLSPYIPSESLFKKFQDSKYLNKYSDISMLPLGGPFEFRITNHDELGRIFDVSPDSNMFSYRIHRSDNIAISISAVDSQKKSTSIKDKTIDNADPLFKYIEGSSFSSHKVLQFQGLGTGENTIQLFYHDLYSDVPQLIDIVCIPTGSVLEMQNYPSNVALEGSRVKYEAPFDNGYWYSSDREIVSIDSLSGEAILKKHGSSNIFYSLINSHPDTDKLPNKNVLISKELSVHIASQLSMKILDWSSMSFEESCSKNECIPVTLNNQANSLIVALYIFSSGTSHYHNENTFKFDREISSNLSEQLKNDVPIECGMDFDINYDPLMNVQDLYEILFKVNVLPVSTDFDEHLGVKQWACYITPAPLNYFSREKLIQFIPLLKSELKLRIKARLRHSVLKSTSISVPVVIGYVLLMSDDNRSSLVIRESGEVITAIRLAIPLTTKNLIEENRNIKLSVTSNRPNLLAVLASREDGTDSGTWIYPLKAVVVDKMVNEKVEITIEFPLTKQKDVIVLHIDIHGKPFSQKMVSTSNSDTEDFELSHVNWFTPVLCVLLTAIVATVIVMIVNYFIRPKIIDDRSLPNPDMSFSGNNYPYSTLHSSPRYTQHVWNSVNTRRDTSPPIHEYPLRSSCYSVNPNYLRSSDSNDNYK